MPTVTRATDNGRVAVEFWLPPEAGAGRAWLAGDFNGWSTEATPLERRDDGSLGVTLELEPGSYRFRYYLGDGAWENDWAADDYVDNEHGGQDSVVVVTAPAPVKKAAPKKAEAKKKPAASTGGAKKAAAKATAKKATKPPPPA